MSFFEQLKQVDFWLFNKINHEWTNSLFDLYFPAITDLHKNPIALLVFAFGIAFWIKQKKKRAAIYLLAMVLSIGASDLISYRVIKAHVQRERPQYSGIAVDLRTHQHSGSSFPSNHSANIFAAATVLTLYSPPLWPFYFFIAGSVAYSRVYVGVHFPFDVLAGAFIGTCIALLIYRIFRKWLRPNSA